LLSPKARFGNVLVKGKMVARAVLLFDKSRGLRKVQLAILVNR
jgi:hypothetical protein